MRRWTIRPSTAFTCSSNVDHRPKMEALARTRFELALYLDADTVVLAPVRDLFDVTAGCDLAMAVEAYRGDKRNLSGPNPVPAAFPPFNSGVIGFNASEGTRAFVARWAEAFRASAADWRFDQRALRETAYAARLSIRTLHARVQPDVGGERARLGRAAPRPPHPAPAAPPPGPARRPRDALRPGRDPSAPAARVPARLAGGRPHGRASGCRLDLRRTAHGPPVGGRRADPPVRSATASPPLCPRQRQRPRPRRARADRDRRPPPPTTAPARASSRFGIAAHPCFSCQEPRMTRRDR